jgi:hypothetical protein
MEVFQFRLETVIDIQPGDELTFQYRLPEDFAMGQLYDEIFGETDYPRRDLSEEEETQLRNYFLQKFGPILTAKVRIVNLESNEGDYWIFNAYYETPLYTIRQDNVGFGALEIDPNTNQVMFFDSQDNAYSLHNDPIIVTRPHWIPITPRVTPQPGHWLKFKKENTEYLALLTGFDSSTNLYTVDCFILGDVKFGFRVEWNTVQLFFTREVGLRRLDVQDLMYV